MSDASTQPPQAPVDQTYGVAGEQLASQQIQPLSGDPLTAPASPSQLGMGGGQGGGGMGGGLGPGQIPTLEDGPVDPNMPVTAGLPNSPGPGPEGLSSISLDPDVTRLKQIQRLYPTDGLARMIEWAEAERSPEMTPMPKYPGADNPAPPLPMDADPELAQAIDASRDEDVDPAGAPIPDKADVDDIAQYAQVQNPSAAPPPPQVDLSTPPQEPPPPAAH